MIIKKLSKKEKILFLIKFSLGLKGEEREEHGE